MRTMRFAAAIASAMALSNPASAGFFDFTLAPYVGASAGQSTTDSCITGTCDKSDIGWKAYGGLEVNEYISMEVGYVDLGTVDYSAPTGTRETHGVTMQLLGTYALNPSFTLLARGGMNFLKTNVSGAVAGASGNAEDTDVVWSLGLGAQYNFTQSVGLRMEWERYFEAGSPAFNGGTGEADVDLISAGLVFKF
ncbi:MAG: outer membrane beta-barrel protein [Rhizobium sp.]|uniref:outer membrane beta-barrel protein n=1 Tax=Thiobacillus sp. TaxID=924 RepID=UPI0025FC7A5E|nr:outer membrane beta-barrel protein [Thiobacillus sp.]MBW8366156.1 outer membrane beta-barrel protein [Rhizobium sp.]